MTISPTDLAHLISLIEAAKAEAVQLGAAGRTVTDKLDEALGSTRAILAQGGQPNEGIAPDELTTANDK